MATIKNKQFLQKLKALDIFRTHLWIYLAVNVFIWLPWFINGNTSVYGWPSYISVGWGIVVLIHYIIVYRKFRKKENVL